LAPEKLTAGDELLLKDWTLLPALPLAAPSYPVQQSLDEDPALSEGEEEEEEEEDPLIEEGKGEEEVGEEGASADVLAPEMLTAEDELILEDYMLLEDEEARDEWEVTRCFDSFFHLYGNGLVSHCACSSNLLETYARIS
jgi:hypothetical protein